MTVDGYEGRLSTDVPSENLEHHWRLPNTDPRNEGKYLFRLHTVDIYFWKASDADTFMDAVQRMLDHDQVEIVDKPPPPATQEHPMSPVVQKLEKVAVQDPAYRNGQTPGSATRSASFASPAPANENREHAAQKADDPGAYKPLAYNPAAPAAPEPIKHREKTPPPPEAETEGTGLSAAAYNDHVQIASPPIQQRQGSLSQPPYGSPPYPHGYGSPLSTQGSNAAYASPPPFAGLTGQSPVPGGGTSNLSFPPPPPLQSNGRSSVTSSTHSPGITGIASQQSLNTFAPPPRDPNSKVYPGGTKAPDSPSAQILGNSYIGSPQQPLQHLQPQYPDYLATRPQPQQQHQQSPYGGYSDYKYSQSQDHHGHHQGSGYDLHNQLYRPTEDEANKHKHHRPSEAGQPTGRLEQQASKVDKGVNRFLKKLEKKIG
ncbi:MAG: hypothetical protein Q9190_007586 [Brigantiaea leucoxantha]